MSNNQFKHVINGEYTTAQSTEYFDLVSPITGQVYAQSPNAEVDAAYAAAKAAAKIWSAKHING